MRIPRRRKRRRRTLYPLCATVASLLSAQLWSLSISLNLDSASKQSVRQFINITTSEQTLFKNNNITTSDSDSSHPKTIFPKDSETTFRGKSGRYSLSYIIRFISFCQSTDEVLEEFIWIFSNISLQYRFSSVCIVPCKSSIKDRQPLTKKDILGLGRSAIRPFLLMVLMITDIYHWRHRWCQIRKRLLFTLKQGWEEAVEIRSCLNSILLDLIRHNSTPNPNPSKWWWRVRVIKRVRVRVRGRIMTNQVEQYGI